MKEKKIKLKKENMLKRKALISYFEILTLIISSFAIAFLISFPEKAIVSAETQVVDVKNEVSFCCEKTTYGAFCQNAPEADCDPAFKKTPTSCEGTSYCKLGCCYDSIEGTCARNTGQSVCQNKEGTWDGKSAFCDIPQCESGCCVLGTEASFVSLARCKKLSAFYNLETDFRKEIGNELECINLAQGQDQGACVYDLDYTKTCKFASRQECDSIRKGESSSSSTSSSASTGTTTAKTETSANTGAKTESTTAEKEKTETTTTTGKAVVSDSEKNKNDPSSGKMTGEVKFYKDMLCSAEELGTNCGPTKQTTCVDGKDEIYFLDSCGNIANIYDASKVNDKPYWKTRVKKEDSCGSGNTKGNSGSKNCGNCDYFYGSICKATSRIETQATYGDSICKNLDCKKTSDGKPHKHGESWCLVDDKPLEKAGGKLNSVGSRYQRAICLNGEEIREPCADYRQEVCIEDTADTDHGVFEEAACRVNRWQTCSGIYDKNKCENSDKVECQWVDDKFCKQDKMDKIIQGASKLGLGGGEEGEGIQGLLCCVPKDAPGLQFWQEESQDSCSLADTICVVNYEKGLFGKGDGKCVKNCECLNENGEWASKQKQKCQALGDCDGKANFIGKSGAGPGYEFQVEDMEKAKQAFAAQQKKSSGSSSGAGQFKNNNFASSSSSSSGSSGTSSGDASGAAQTAASTTKSASDTTKNVGEIAKGISGKVVATGDVAITGDAPVPFTLGSGIEEMAGVDSLGGAAAASSPGNIAPAIAPTTTSGYTASIGGKNVVGTLVDNHAGKVILQDNAGKTIGTYDSGTKTWSAGTGGGTNQAASQSTDILGTLWQDTLVQGLVHGLIVGGIGYLIGSLLGPKNSNAGTAAFWGGMAAGMSFDLAQGLIAGQGIKLFGWQAVASGSPAWGMSAAGATILSGAIGIGVGFAVFAVLYKEKNKKVVIFRCQPWEAPHGGQECEKCNNDLFPCTEYKCKSLGQGCELLNKGTGNEKCYWKNRNDVLSPGIQPLETILTKGYKYTDVVPIPPGAKTPGKMKIVSDKGGCIKAFTPITFGITNYDENKEPEPAKCAMSMKVSSTKRVMDQMDFVFDSGLYLSNHSITLNLPPPGAISAESPTIQNNGEYSWYVKCIDGNGNQNEGEFNVKFCVEKGPDAIAPEILGTSMQNGNCFQFGLSSTDMEVYVSEPSTCKWDTLDKGYDDMANSMTCASSLTELNNVGVYKCTTTLTGLKDRVENKFFFKCKDKPNAAEKDRNPMRESYPFTLKGSEPLSIQSVKPKNATIIDSREVIPVNLEIETQAGCSTDGKSDCYYSQTGNEDWILFESDIVTPQGNFYHNQSLNLPANYIYKFFFKCIDGGGNVDRNESIFALAADRSPPLITRAYQDGDKLKILTNEKSTCVFNNNKATGCNYKHEEGIQMQYVNSTEHITAWDAKQTYFVKCEDQMGGNRPAFNLCSFIARPSEISNS